MPTRYVIAPRYALRGWKYLPFALQHLNSGRSEFFPKDDYLLLAKCDGRHDIDIEALSDKEKMLMDRWLSGKFIRPVENGETLLPYQEYVLYTARFKESVQWSITGKCNYNCKHCFMSAPHSLLGEPSFEDCMKMIDEFAHCGIRTINLTGGEPLVRKDFWDIVDAVLKKGLDVGTIYSNGLLTNDDFFAKLEERNLHPTIQFSFDGVGRHDWLRGVDGAEKIVCDALAKCRDRHIHTSVSMCLFRENRDTLRDSVNLLASLGCGAMKVNVTSPQGEWLTQQDHILTQEEAYQAYLDYLPHYFEDGKPLPLMLEGFFVYDNIKNRVGAAFEKGCPEESFGKCSMCGHVRANLYVSPEGYVLPCMSLAGTTMQPVFPKILDMPLEDIINDSIYWKMADMRVSDYMEHNPECSKCEYRTDCCGGCRSAALRTGGDDYLAPDLWTCEYFKGGWKEKKDALLLELQKKYDFEIC